MRYVFLISGRMLEMSIDVHSKRCHAPLAILLKNEKDYNTIKSAIKSKFIF